MDSEGSEPSSGELSVEAVLTPEAVKNLQTLELEATGDFSQALEALNATLGTTMQARPEGYHLTIISPPERGKLSTLTPEQIAKLQQINAAIQSGEGIAVNGVGYIDGTTAPQIRDADKAKRTSYLAVEIPTLNGFREELGLPEKDFHITLGIEGGDIHMLVVGQNEKGKDILATMPKKANPDLDHFTPSKVEFGKISGKQRQQSTKSS